MNTSSHGPRVVGRHDFSSHYPDNNAKGETATVGLFLGNTGFKSIRLKYFVGRGNVKHFGLLLHGLTNAAKAGGIQRQSPGAKNRKVLRPFAEIKNEDSAQTERIYKQYAFK